MSVLSRHKESIHRILRDFVIELEAGVADWEKDAKDCEKMQDYLYAEIQDLCGWRICCMTESVLIKERENREAK
jgi:hypothetical protein